MTRNTRVVAVLILVGLTAACSRKPPVEQPTPQPPPVQQQPPASTPPAPSNDAADRAAEARRIAALLEQVVHFDYDEATIRADAQERLAAKVPVLRSNAAIQIRVEGHADERGSVEYNLALGMRRANAVRDYLTGFGINVSRITVQSFGEDRPMANGSTESAYSQNRRAEFRVTSGLNMQ